MLSNHILFSKENINKNLLMDNNKIQRDVVKLKHLHLEATTKLSSLSNEINVVTSNYLLNGI